MDSVLNNFGEWRVIDICRKMSSLPQVSKGDTGDNESRASSRNSIAESIQIQVASSESSESHNENQFELDLLEGRESKQDSRCSSASLLERRVGVTPAGDAVVIRNGMKSYKRGQPVLQGLNMTVPCGSIYGLLGSSGCGKTTVLACLVGIRQLDKGKIWIFGEKPGSSKVGIPGRNVGYMPQEISLYNEFTIGETLNYFGTLSGMNKEELKNARNFLISLLDLPEEGRRIENLSVGQQRRVSLVAALIGGPELLILDEPTVGVDPIIRQNIWTHLQKLVQSQRTTVIVTTHYIEECRNADNIGIMRNGRLLEERPPGQLMVEHNSTNLEAIVLTLSRQDKGDKSSEEDVSPSKAKKKQVDVEKGDKKPPKMASVLREPDTGITFALYRIKALTGKNLVVLYRNPLLLFFVVLIASLMLTLMCITLGSNPRELPFGIINKEAEHRSACPNYTRVVGECHVEMLSCQYLSHLNNGVLNLEVYNDEEEAKEAVQSGACWGYVIFPEDFSENFYQRTADGTEPDDMVLNASQINIKLDESNKQITAAIKVALYEGFQDFIVQFLYDCGFDTRQGEFALKYRKPLFGDDTTDFREFLSPGAGIALIFFFPILTTSVRYIGEKKSGVLHRSIVSGVRTWEIMFAYSITEFCVLFFQSILCYAVINIVFDIKVLGSTPLVIALYLLSGYGGVGMGFLLGAICSEEIAAAMAGMAAFFPNFILSGLVWPPEGMDESLQYVVKVLPCTMAAEAVRSIISRGWEFSHPHVWPGFAILVAYIFGYFILTILFHVIFRK